ncbi:MAG: GNAT family N-acetyltransferase [Methylomonas sp.]|jgi:GNAT superfamily N-acetyltransferase
MTCDYFDGANGFDMTLSDGESIRLRPVNINDRKIIMKGMFSLSSQSRFFRFFFPILTLTDEQLRYFTEVDQQNHVAWLAVSQDQAEPTGYGIARFIRSQPQPHIAEFALVVIDSHQKRGLGVILMSLLYILARIKKIEILRASMLPENTVMSHWLGRLGATGEYKNGVYWMNLNVLNDLSTQTSLSLQRLNDTIKKIEEAVTKKIG